MCDEEMTGTGPVYGPSAQKRAEAAQRALHVFRLRGTTAAGNVFDTTEIAIDGDAARLALELARPGWIVTTADKVGPADEPIDLRAIDGQAKIITGAVLTALRLGGDNLAIFQGVRNALGLLERNAARRVPADASGVWAGEQPAEALRPLDELLAAAAGAEPILQFFASAHLPETLRLVSLDFGWLALGITRDLPRNPERTVALRKLLEAKDCAVRARLFKAGEAGR